MNKQCNQIIRSLLVNLNIYSIKSTHRDHLGFFFSQCLGVPNEESNKCTQSVLENVQLQKPVYRFFFSYLLINNHVRAELENNFVSLRVLTADRPVSNTPPK